MQATDRFFPTARCAAVLVALLWSGVAALAQAPTPSGRVTVSDVIIQGSRLVPTEQIRAQLKTAPGMEYSRAVVEEDVRTLYATKQFGNVSPFTQDDGPGKVKVYFFIRDYPSVVQEVVYQGAKHLSDDDLNSITGIRKGAPLNPHANKVACLNIVRRLNEDGRPFASCDLLSGAEPGDTKVVFNITEGHKVKVKDVRFEGNTFVSGAVLKTHVNTSNGFLGLLGNTYNGAMVDADVGALETYYRSFGYH